VYLFLINVSVTSLIHAQNIHNTQQKAVGFVPVIRGSFRRWCIQHTETYRRDVIEKGIKNRDVNLVGLWKKCLSYIDPN